jgi:hypothetical protein
MPESKKDNPVIGAVKESGRTADATVDVVGKTGSNVVTETGKTVQSAERAVTGVGTGAIRGVGKMGGEAGGLAKKAVTNTAALPHDIIKSAKTGEPEK